MTTDSAPFLKPLVYNFEYQGVTGSISSGYLAPTLAGGLTLKLGNMVLLVTTVVANEMSEAKNFVPLNVTYQEKRFAVGQIPQSHNRREGRISNHEILVRRFIDRSLRPLIPKDFFHEIQIICQVLSYDERYDAGLWSLMLSGVSALCAGVPLSDTVAGIHVCEENIATESKSTEISLMATKTTRSLIPSFITCVDDPFDRIQDKKMNIFVAGTRMGINMIEGALSDQRPEHVINILKKAQAGLIPLLDIADYFVKFWTENNKYSDTIKNLLWYQWQDEENFMGNLEENPKKKSETIPSNKQTFFHWWDKEALPLLYKSWSEIVKEQEKKTVVTKTQNKPLFAGKKTYIRSEFYLHRELLWLRTKNELTKQAHALCFHEGRLNIAFESIESQLMQAYAINRQTRFDGRTTDEIRKIQCETDILPNVSSTLFTRGGTQVLATAIECFDQKIRNESFKDGFADPLSVHYTYYPFASNETGKLNSINPSARELGHGKLVTDALRYSVNMTRGKNAFVNTMVYSSDGSSSQASVCAGSLALYKIGLTQILTAGIAMGLGIEKANINPFEKKLTDLFMPEFCKDEDEIIIFSDITQTEDQYGCIDLKMAGSMGITAIQMDTKLRSLSISVLSKIITQAFIGIQKIKAIMEETIITRPILAAVYEKNIEIADEHIGILIGTKGQTIRALSEQTQSQISIDQKTNKVFVSASSEAQLAKAIETIHATVTNKLKEKMAEKEENIALNAKIIEAAIKTEAVWVEPSKKQDIVQEYKPKDNTEKEKNQDNKPKENTHYEPKKHFAHQNKATPTEEYKINKATASISPASNTESLQEKHAKMQSEAIALKQKQHHDKGAGKTVEKTTENDNFKPHNKKINTDLTQEEHKETEKKELEKNKTYTGILSKVTHDGAWVKIKDYGTFWLNAEDMSVNNILGLPLLRHAKDEVLLTVKDFITDQNKKKQPKLGIIPHNNENKAA